MNHQPAHNQNDCTALVEACLREASPFQSQTELLACFNRGLSLNYLERLLSSSNVFAIQCGLFIAEEMGRTAASVCPLVHGLCKHSDEAIRYMAFEALGRCIELNTAQLGSELLVGLFDASERCRRICALSLIRLDMDLFLSAVTTASAHQTMEEVRTLGSLLRMSNAANENDIADWVIQSDTNYRFAALILAGRAGPRAEMLLSQVAASDDREIAWIAAVQLRHIDILTRGQIKRTRGAKDQ
jgi:hypothetical protein